MATLLSLQLISYYLQWQKSPKTPVQFTRIVCETPSKLLSLSPNESVKVQKSISADKLSVHTVQFEKVTGVLWAPHDYLTFFLSNIKNSVENTEDT